jgi:hypothetical protein
MHRTPAISIAQLCEELRTPRFSYRNIRSLQTNSGLSEILFVADQVIFLDNAYRLE